MWCAKCHIMNTKTFILLKSLTAVSDLVQPNQPFVLSSSTWSGDSCEQRPWLRDSQVCRKHRLVNPGGSGTEQHQFSEMKD